MTMVLVFKFSERHHQRVNNYTMSKETTIELEAKIIYHKEIVYVYLKKEWILTNPCRPMGDWKTTRIFITVSK